MSVKYIKWDELLPDIRQSWDVDESFHPKFWVTVNFHNSMWDDGNYPEMFKEWIKQNNINIFGLRVKDGVRSWVAFLIETPDDLLEIAREWAIKKS